MSLRITAVWAVSACPGCAGLGGVTEVTGPEPEDCQCCPAPASCSRPATLQPSATHRRSFVTMHCNISAVENEIGSLTMCTHAQFCYKPEVGNFQMNNNKITLSRMKYAYGL